MNSQGKGAQVSLPWLFASWIVTTIALVLLALGAYATQLHGGLIDFLASERSARAELGGIGFFASVSMVAGLAFALAAVILFVIAFKRRDK